MRKLFVVLALVSVVGCGKKAAETPQKKQARGGTTFIGQPTDLRNAKIKETLPIEFTVVERSALGSRLDAAGNVVESQDTFKPGDPVYVTMWLKTSPSGLQTSVKFTDPNGKQTAWPAKPMNGAKVATFKLDTAKLAPGEYKAECYWGANSEHEYTFKIAQAGKKKK